MKLSEKDKKLLLILGSIGIVAGAYFFGYGTIAKKREQILVEIEQKKIRYDTLAATNENRESYLNETEQLKEKTKEIAMLYPSEVTQEKEVYTLSLMEKYANVDISSLAYSEESDPFYTPEVLVTDNTIGENSGIEETNLAEETEQELEQGEEAEKVSQSFPTSSIYGYRTLSTIAFQSGYDELKKLVEYLNTSEDNQCRRTIDSISLSFDGTTGKLSGTLAYNNYFVTGTSSEYIAPEIANIDSGRDNIFGTIPKTKVSSNSEDTQKDTSEKDTSEKDTEKENSTTKTKEETTKE